MEQSNWDQQRGQSGDLLVMSCQHPHSRTPQTANGLSENSQLQRLRLFLSNYVTDIAFSDSEIGYEGAEEEQEITLDDWKKIERLQFCKFDCGLSKIIARSMTNLKELQLNSCGIEEEGVKIICAWFPKLTSLDLSGNSIRETGGLAIANNLTGLTKLNLEDNKVGDLAIISISHRLKNLEVADFGNNKIGNLGAAKIAANLRKLKQLRIGWNNITTAGAEKLTAMRQLTYLNIKTNYIQTKGGIALSRALSDLSFFRVGNNRIGDYGAVVICENCSKLEGLGLWDSALTSNSLQKLGKLQKLTWLTVAHNNLSETDILELCQSLTNLKYFDVSKIDISEQGRNALKQTLPQCVFEFSDTA